jgi:hypothetical protein
MRQVGEEPDKGHGEQRVKLQGRSTEKLHTRQCIALLIIGTEQDRAKILFCKAICNNALSTTANDRQKKNISSKRAKKEDPTHLYGEVSHENGTRAEKTC